MENQLGLDSEADGRTYQNLRTRLLCGFLAICLAAPSYTTFRTNMDLSRLVRLD
jgi:hypothetical protein